MTDEKFSEWFNNIMLECKNECPYRTCLPGTEIGRCKLFIQRLHRHIINLRTKEEFMFSLLDGRYRIRRRDKLNIVIDKMVMKKAGTRRDKDGNEIKIGGYEAYTQLGGYHSNVTDAIGALYDDVLNDNVGTEKELTTVEKLRKNLLKIKQQIIDEVSSVEDSISSLLTEGKKKGGKEKDDE